MRGREGREGKGSRGRGGWVEGYDQLMCLRSGRQERKVRERYEYVVRKERVVKRGVEKCVTLTLCPSLLLPPPPPPPHSSPSVHLSSSLPLTPHPQGYLTEFNGLYEEFKGKGVELYAITAQLQEDTDRFMKEYNLRFKVRE